MSKTQTQGIQSRKDLIGIANIANLSESTLIKWYERKLVVKPETELKIYEATSQFYKERKMRRRLKVAVKDCTN